MLDLGDAELLHVRHVLEVPVARAKAGGTAEVVDRDCVVAGLGEPLGQLAVERVEAADVGKDHDPRSVSLGDSASEAEKRVPSELRSSTSSAAAPPAIGGNNRSAGGAGGRAS